MVIIFSFSSNRVQLDTMLNHDVFFIFIFMRVQTVKTKKKKVVILHLKTPTKFRAQTVM